MVGRVRVCDEVDISTLVESEINTLLVFKTDKYLEKSLAFNCRHVRASAGNYAVH